MKTNVKLIIIALIGCITLISVGFAAWTVTKPLDKYEGSFDVIVFESMDNAKYIEIADSTVFDYYNTGFVENDDTITKTGNITVSFNLKINDYKDSFKESSGMTIELLLKHASDSAGLYMFENDASTPFTFTPTVSDELDGAYSATTSSRGCLVTINLETLPSDDVSFTVTFSVNYSGTYAEFKENVFPHLPQVRFAVEAKITSK